MNNNKRNIKMEKIVKILKGHRITIPTEICRKLKINEGDFVILKVENETIKIIPAEIKARKNA